jgi:hypothetical protein
MESLLKDRPDKQNISLEFLAKDTTSFAKWVNYTQHLFSPNSYKAATYVFMASTAMTRRVWVGQRNDNAIWPNTFTLLIGLSAAGKGLSMNAATRILRIPRIGQHPMFWCGPDDASYQSIMESISKSTRPTESTPPYAYSALYLHLQEVQTLFKKFAESTIKLLLCAWDGDKYTYTVRHSASFDLSNMAINLVGGGVIDEVMDLIKMSRIMTDGFVSRTMMIFDSKNSNNEFELPPFSPSQIQDQADLVECVTQVGKRLGAYYISLDDRKVLAKYWHDFVEAKACDPTNKVNSFYARFRHHIPKVALAFHIMEDMTVPQISAKALVKAIHYLEFVANNMEENLSPPKAAPPVHAGTVTPQEEKDPLTLKVKEVVFAAPNGLMWGEVYLACKELGKPRAVHIAALSLVSANVLSVSGTRLIRASAQ